MTETRQHFTEWLLRARKYQDHIFPGSAGRRLQTADSRLDRHVYSHRSTRIVTARRLCR